jgi:hypothetical protein
VAAIVVGVFALAAIPTMLLRQGGTARSADAAGTPPATVEATPIQMFVVHTADPAPAAADGSIQLQGQSGPVLSLVFNADESMMAGTDRAGDAHVWTRAGKLLATVLPASGLRIASVAFALKDQQFVTVSSDGSMHFWPLPAAA